MGLGGLKLFLDDDEFREFKNLIARMHNLPGVDWNGRIIFDDNEVSKLEPKRSSYC